MALVETVYDSPEERLEFVWAHDNSAFLGVIKTLRNSEDRPLTVYESWRETRNPAGRKVQRFPCRDAALEFLCFPDGDI